MHRKQDFDLIPADTELEETLRSLRKTQREENAAMAEEKHDQTAEQRTTTRSPPITDEMEDFMRPIIREEYYAIDELKSHLFLVHFSVLFSSKND